ncbi:MAG: hypothetical protein JST19_00765 [Bacteroidetes bacterium]|nr:hypothetical protein [Bacteroidota bacterium]
MNAGRRFISLWAIGPAGTVLHYYFQDWLVWFGMAGTGLTYDTWDATHPIKK